MRPLQLIRLMRPTHWIKSLIVFLPVLFAMRIYDRGAWIAAAAAAAALCLASSAVYVFNDLMDRGRDRLHPRKKFRPLAAGTVSPAVAVILAAACGAGAMIVAGTVGLRLLYIVIIYILLQTAYSTVLKRVILLDVICIAVGFVLRAVAGAFAINASVSPWLFVCTFTICLFMGFCKRCNELATIDNAEDAHNHRVTLAGYRPELLTHLMTLSAAVAIIAFMLYATSDSPTRPDGAEYSVYTLPIVVYAVFRFAMLSMQGRYCDPTEVIVRDRAFQLTCVIWLGTVVAVLVWHEQLDRIVAATMPAG